MYVNQVRNLRAKGAYSLAVQDGSTIYISGQLPVNLETGDLQTGSAGEETRLILNNMEAILAEYGLDRNQILKTTVYMTDPAYWAEINEAFQDFFTQAKPVRSAVVTGAIPSLGFKVEIEAIATTNSLEIGL